MKLKVIAFTLSLLGTLNSISAETMHINSASVFAPQRLGNIALSHDGNRFKIEKNGKTHDVQNYRVDAPLRNIAPKHLAAFLNKGYISVNQNDAGEYSLQANVRGLGGGAGGAMIGIFGAKFLTHLVGHSIIAGISGVSSLVVPGSGPVVFISLEKTFGPVIEAVSIKMALAGGLAGGIITGPM